MLTSSVESPTGRLAATIHRPLGGLLERTDTNAAAGECWHQQRCGDELFIASDPTPRGERNGSTLTPRRGSPDHQARCDRASATPCGVRCGAAALALRSVTGRSALA